MTVTIAGSFIGVHPILRAWDDNPFRSHQYKVDVLFPSDNLRLCNPEKKGRTCAYAHHPGSPVLQEGEARDGAPSCEAPETCRTRDRRHARATRTNPQVLRIRSESLYRVPKTRQASEELPGVCLGEAIYGGLIAVGISFGWGIVVYLGIAGFFTCWANTWFKGNESYADTRLHGYVFSGTLIFVALILMSLPPTGYDPAAAYRVDHKRNSLTYKTELVSGVEMQRRNQRRLRVMNNIGIAVLVIGGAVLLCRVAGDVQKPSSS
jgi:hypothetical protein